MTTACFAVLAMVALPCLNLELSLRLFCDFFERDELNGEKFHERYMILRFFFFFMILYDLYKYI